MRAKSINAIACFVCLYCISTVVRLALSLSVNDCEPLSDASAALWVAANSILIRKGCWRGKDRVVRRVAEGCFDERGEMGGLGFRGHSPSSSGCSNGGFFRSSVSRNYRKTNTRIYFYTHHPDINSVLVPLSFLRNFCREFCTPGKS